MIGDTTIILNRSMFVDFTLPYTESGVQMVVPTRENWSKSLWVFMKPIEPVLWVAILAVFLLTGVVIWFVERKDSRYFGGNAGKQLVNIAYFNFQALILSVPKGELSRTNTRMSLFFCFLIGIYVETNGSTFVLESIIYFAGFLCLTSYTKKSFSRFL